MYSSFTLPVFWAHRVGWAAQCTAIDRLLSTGGAWLIAALYWPMPIFVATSGSKN